jgi:hypothetical protein
LSNTKNAAFVQRGETFGGVENAKIFCCAALFYNSRVFARCENAWFSSEIG